MINRFTIPAHISALLTFLAIGILPVSADTEKDDELSPDAVRIEAELRETFKPESEAIAMLDAIIEGSTLNGDDGWFPLAKSQTRFDWKYVTKSYDQNLDDTVTADEFTGTREQFSRLDRNGDQRLTPADFDWSDHALTPTPGFMLFFMADQDGNGKVTREEFNRLFDQLGGAESDFLALDDLRDLLSPPSPGPRPRRADHPTRSTLIAALKDQEIGSLQPGPSLNHQAPDFTLTTLQGDSVTLSREIGEKPVVLIFGNFTCGPFRSQSGNLEKLYLRYRDQAKFFLVYVREAHPNDGWWMQSNQRVGIDVPQPKAFEARREIAAECQSRLELPIPFLVDDVDDQVGTQYSGMPNRLYLIDREGRVAFKSGRGPFGFHPRQLEQALVLLLNEDD
jgi:hypothetical protein